METMNSFFDSVCEKNKDNLFCVGEEYEFTYFDLAKSVNKCISFLSHNTTIKDRLDENEYIYLSGKQNTLWIILFFSLLKIKKKIIPVNKLSFNHYPFISEMLFSTEEELNEFSNVYTCYIKESDFYKSTNSSMINNFTLDEKNIVVLLSTSGTTSKSKLVELSSLNILSNVNAIDEIIEINNSTVQILPLDHAFGLTTFLLGMKKGCTFYLSGTARSFFNDIKKYSPNYLFAVPSILQSLAVWIEKDLQSKDFIEKCKLIISGGGNLENSIIDFYKNIGITVLNGYGVTEGSPVISVNTINKSKKNSVGRILNCNVVRIKKMNSQIKHGYIYIKGSNVFNNYYNEKSTLENGWYNTKDIGYLDSEDYLYLIGRANNVIVFNNGEKIIPEIIENDLLNSCYIDDAILYLYKEKLILEIYSKDANYNYSQIELLVNEYNRHAEFYKTIYKTIFRKECFTKNKLGKIIRGDILEERKNIFNIFKSELLEFDTLSTDIKEEQMLSSLDISSMDLFLLISNLENTLHINLDDDELYNIKRVIDLIDILYVKKISIKYT